MANDSRSINDIYNNGLNAAYGKFPRSQNLVVKTGQTVSYQSDDDGAVQAGLAVPETRFESFYAPTGDQLVIDRHTGLMWPVIETFFFMSAMSSNYSWSAWASYVKGLYDNYGGYDGWRLPNILELASLFDHSTGQFCSAIDPGSFMDKDVWSGITSAADTTKAYTLGKINEYSILTKTDTTCMFLACRNVD